MKITQTRHHWIAKRALTTPGIREVAERRLVSLHVDVFTDLSPPSRVAERREHLQALFDRLVDAYRAAVADQPEAAAREAIHVMANADFFEHGWTELMEIPGRELPAHFERHREFLDEHGVSQADPLGEFRGEPLPEAPRTTEKLRNPTYPNAEPGYADAVYVEGADGEVHVGADRPEPADISLADIPRVAPKIEARYDVTPSFTDGDATADG
ncbi:DUF6149 family protein [Halosegnis sp.]|uniref:DUF6149 family protein n=1 Tax=Halosegnis sp. TaxID=2864959 RepID=UPI0035D419F2